MTENKTRVFQRKPNNRKIRTKTWIVFIFLWGVRGPFAEMWQYHPWNKTWRFRKETGSDDVKKLQSQALKSLKKAAVAIFPPSPPNIAKCLSSLGYIVVFMAYKKPVFSWLVSPSPPNCHPTSPKSSAWQEIMQSGKKQNKTTKQQLFWQSNSLFLHCFCWQCKD